jgi:TRAP-type C4-dicarboxylate transport system permease large subunit
LSSLGEGFQGVGEFVGGLVALELDLVVCAIFNCSIVQYVKESKYLWIATLATIIIVLLIPQLSLWLPELIF